MAESDQDGLKLYGAGATVSPASELSTAINRLT